MKLNGWEYDFESLPHWDIRDKIPYVTDLLYENRRLDTAFLIYSIVEYRMLSYAGNLAILRNKKAPELVLRVEEGLFGNSEVLFSMDGRLAFAKSDMWDGGWPIFVFDLESEKFACFRTTTNNNGFSVKEIERNEFVVIADEWQMKHDAHGLLEKLNGTKIVTDSLEWMPFGDIDSFCVQFRKSRRKGPKTGFLKRFYRFLVGRPTD